MERKNSSPHGIMKWIFGLMADSEEKKTILGDMEEYYSEIAANEGNLKAVLWFWNQILQTAFCFFKYSIYWSYVMFANYVKTAVRNFRKHKSYSILNITGLAIGLASVIIINLYIHFELSYDKYHKNAGRIYRITDEKFPAPHTCYQKI